MNILKSVLDKISKTIDLIRNFETILPRLSLFAIYKTFVRPYLDYGGIIFDQTYDKSFHSELKSIQYSACLAIRHTSSEKLNQESGLETLQSRQWFRWLCLSYKIVNNQSPSYLHDYIPSSDRIHNTRHADKVPTMKSEHTLRTPTFLQQL